jgi:hypothetical protein
MKRAASIALLFTLALPLLTPVAAALAPPEVPACCREGGAHHCQRSSHSEGESFRAQQRFHECPVKCCTLAGPVSGGVPVRVDAVLQLAAQPQAITPAEPSKDLLSQIFVVALRGPPLLSLS